jgi:hypothetical protein
VRLDCNLDERYWMQTLGVSRKQLREAIAAVGMRVDAVTSYLDVAARNRRCLSDI